MAVLGLTDPGGGDWARLRGLQYASLAKASVARMATHGIAALAVAGLFIGHVHYVALIAWLAALAASLHYSSKIDATLVDADRRSMSPDEVKRQTVSAIFNALIWVVPTAVFSLWVDVETQLKLWTVLAMLMAASAILLPGVPLGTLMFTGIVGGAAAVEFLFGGLIYMTVAVLAFSVTISAGATGLHFGVFMLASVIARGLRFFVIAALLWRYGAPIRDFIEERLGLVFSLGLAALIGGFLVIELGR